ncbi:MAG: hypothetical protein GX801_06880 [Fibrobacter sp.]|nr:hypothetical protein [Fibrobacter sp.]
MRKLLLIISSFAAILWLASCGEPLECYPASRISFLSTAHVDSVHFFLNEERICYEERTFFPDGGWCANCEEIKGIHYEGIACFVKDANALSGPKIYSIEYIEICRTQQEFCIWNAFSCDINEKQFGKSLDSKMLKLVVYSGAEEVNITQVAFNSKNHYYIMPEVDGENCFNFSEETVIGLSNVYRTPDYFSTANCANGYCVSLNERFYDPKVCYSKRIYK